MPIKVPCACGARLNVTEALAGKRVRCPQCKKVHQVPDASAFQVVPGPKRADEEPPPAPAPAKKGISLKGKGDAAAHSGRVSEPTMVMSADALQEAIAALPKEEDPPPPPPAEPPIPGDDEPTAKLEEQRGTRVRRLDAKEHLKKIKQELVTQKDEAGTRYVPGSSGLAKTRNAEPTMVITRDQIRAAEAAEEEAPPAEPPPGEEPTAPVEPPKEEPPPSTVELPHSDSVRPAFAPAPVSGTPTLGLLVVAALCFFVVVVSLAYQFISVLPGRSIVSWVTLLLTGVAGLVAVALAFKR